MLKAGNSYYVSDISSDEAKKNKRSRTYLGTSVTGSILFDDGHWAYVAPIAAPWTQDTFPKDELIWIKGVEDTYDLVIRLGTECVGAYEGDYTYQELADNFTQPDGSPCGTNSPG